MICGWGRQAGARIPAKHEFCQEPQEIIERRRHGAGAGAGAVLSLEFT